MTNRRAKSALSSWSSLKIFNSSLLGQKTLESLHLPKPQVRERSDPDLDTEPDDIPF
jgi:hypothetical protein